MSETARLVNIAVIIVGFLALTWLSRRAALDVDREGGPGWIVGLLVLFVPPLGLVAWLLLRNRESEGAK